LAFLGVSVVHHLRWNHGLQNSPQIAAMEIQAAPGLFETAEVPSAATITFSGDEFTAIDDIGFQLRPTEEFQPKV
jgi:hypothetical protein